MKTVSAFLCIFLVSTTLSFNIAPNNDGTEDANEVEGSAEDVLNANFLKVLSAMLVRKISVPMELKQAVKSVMREFLNGQPRKEGYLNYLQESMLGVVNSSTAEQMDNMLRVMEEMSPKESVMSKASALVRNWFQSDAGKEFLESVSIYVKNLFHKNRKFLPKIPDLQASSNQNSKQKPATLPAAIDDSENEARNQPDARFALENRLTNFKKINDGNKVVVVVGGGSGDERRPGHGRPSKPGYPGDRDRDRYPGNRPGDRDRYPEGGNYPEERPHNHPRPGGGNYPEDRPHNHPRPGGYPEDRPHNHPRPGGGNYPEDRPHNHPGRPGDYYPEDRPQGYPDRPHGKPNVDKVCIERIPGSQYRPRSSRLLKSK